MNAYEIIVIAFIVGGLLVFILSALVASKRADRRDSGDLVKPMHPIWAGERGRLDHSWYFTDKHWRSLCQTWRISEEMLLSMQRTGSDGIRCVICEQQEEKRTI